MDLYFSITFILDLWYLLHQRERRWRGRGEKKKAEGQRRRERGGEVRRKEEEEEKPVCEWE